MYLKKTQSLTWFLDHDLSLRRIPMFRSFGESLFGEGESLRHLFLECISRMRTMGIV